MKNIYPLISDINQLVGQAAKEGVFDPKAFLLNHGQVFFTGENFVFTPLIDELNLFFVNKLKLGTEIIRIGADFVKIIYKPVKGIKKAIRLDHRFSVLLLKTDIRVWVGIVAEDDVNNPAKKEFLHKVASIFDDSHDKEIMRFIADYFLSFFEVPGEEIIAENNAYIAHLTSAGKTAWYSMRENGEILLAALEISEIIQHPQIKSIDKKQELFYFLSDRSACIAGFDTRGNIVFLEDFAQKSIVVKPEIGRDPVTCGEIKWYSTRSNDVLFSGIQNVTQVIGNERIRSAAALNFTGADKNFALQLLLKLTKSENHVADLWSLFYMLFSDESLKNDIPEKKIALNDLIQNTTQTPQTEQQFLDWIEKWQIGAVEKTALMYLILTTAETDEARKKFIAVHKTLFAQIQKGKNDDNLKFISTYIFLRHLALCDDKSLGREILRQTEENLPNDDFLDFITDTENDRGDYFGSGYFMFELLKLSRIIDAEKNIQQVVGKQILLQALNDSAVDEALKILSNTEKLTQIDKIRKHGLSIPTQTINKDAFGEIPPKMISQFLLPKALRKSGVMDFVVPTLEKIPEHDFSAVKAFAEPLTEQSHTEIYSIIHTIRKALGLQVLEIYIARGEASLGITAFDGKPPFLVIGISLLDSQHRHFLNPGEAAFCIGAQLSMVAIKFASLTSTNEWDAWYEKSAVSSKLSEMIKIGNSATNRIENYKNYGEIKHFFESETKSGDYAYVLDLSKQLAQMLRASEKPEKKDLQNIAVQAVCSSVLFTSDRAGLLFSGDIESALSAIIKTKIHYSDETEKLHEKGFDNIMFAKKLDGSLKYPELVLRIHNLFSFYLSNDYMELRRVLTMKK